MRFQVARCLDSEDSLVVDSPEELPVADVKILVVLTLLAEVNPRALVPNPTWTNGSSDTSTFLPMNVILNVNQIKYFYSF